VTLTNIYNLTCDVVPGKINKKLIKGYLILFYFSDMGTRKIIFSVTPSKPCIIACLIWFLHITHKLIIIVLILTEVCIDLFDFIWIEK